MPELPLAQSIPESQVKRLLAGHQSAEPLFLAVYYMCVYYGLLNHCYTQMLTGTAQAQTLVDARRVSTNHSKSPGPCLVRLHIRDYSTRKHCSVMELARIPLHHRDFPWSTG